MGGSQPPAVGSIPTRSIERLGKSGLTRLPYKAPVEARWFESITAHEDVSLKGKERYP